MARSKTRPDTSSWRKRLVPAAEALLAIQPGDRVFVGSACATPRALVHALETSDRTLDDVQLIHFLTDGVVPRVNGIASTQFRHKVFFVGSDTRALVARGKVEYIPLSITDVHRLIDRGGIPLDVALVQVSTPDEAGNCSLGVSVDVTHTAVRRARKVIAEINPNMPRTLGDTEIALEDIHAIVEVDTPIIEYVHSRADEIAERIARYVARIIDDGCTLQIGLGRIPNEMLKYLTNRRDLGIHSDVITDSLLDLIEKGVVNGSRKTLHPGLVVASLCMGTRRLYDLVDGNPMFRFEPIHVVCDAATIAANAKMVSVTQAFAMDLTGQVCADQFEGELYGGVSSQPEFMRGAAASEGGKPIICLASTTDDGQSRIRAALKEGEAATIARSDVHYVVTEYGTAYLFGRTIRERAIALIEIAHPKFRDSLLADAKRLGYVPQKIALKSRGAYPEHEQRQAVLKNGSSVHVRPTRASDLEAIQELFHRLSPEDVYTRFFTNLSSLSISNAQHLCSVSYEQEMAFLVVTGDSEREIVVASACYYVNPSTNLADVAFMTHPEWQGLGLGSLLQSRLAEYARARGVRGFTADVLCKNEKMLAVFGKSSGKLTKRTAGPSYEVTLIFD